MPKPQRGKENRGTIRWGWVPPEGSLVVIKNNKTLQSCMEYSEEQLLAQLEQDLLKVLADKLREQLSG